MLSIWKEIEKYSPFEGGGRVMILPCEASLMSWLVDAEITGASPSFGCKHNSG